MQIYRVCNSDAVGVGVEWGGVVVGVVVGVGGLKDVEMCSAVKCGG